MEARLLVAVVCLVASASAFSEESEKTDLDFLQEQ